jgi:hypothetical protein
LRPFFLEETHPVQQIFVSGIITQEIENPASLNEHQPGISRGEPTFKCCKSVFFVTACGRRYGNDSQAIVMVRRLSLGPPSAVSASPVIKKPIM